MEATTTAALTTRELQRLYLAHAQVYYRRRDGSPTREHLNIRTSLDRFNRFAGEAAQAEKINRHQLRAWLDQLAAEGLCRSYINQSLSRVRRWLRWAADLDYITDQALQEIARVRPLPPHRSAAAEPRRRTAAPLDQARLVLPFLPPLARDVLQLLMLTGARLGEVLEARNRDIFIDDEGPRLIPEQHKNAHHGKARVIPLTGQALAIVERRRRWLCPNDALFPAPRSSRKHHYSPEGLRAALRRACTAAAVAPFTPHQLRHAVAAQVRRTHGIDAARALLGHSAVSMTDHYAPLDFKAAQEAAQAVAAIGGCQ